MYTYISRYSLLAIPYSQIGIPYELVEAHPHSMPTIPKGLHHKHREPYTASPSRHPHFPDIPWSNPTHPWNRQGNIIPYIGPI